MAISPELLAHWRALGISCLGLDAAGLSRLDNSVEPRNLTAGVAVEPASSADVATIAADAARHGLSLVAQGGRTGLAGGAVSVPGQVIVSTRQLNKIHGIAPLAMLADVDAGVTLAQLAEALAPHGLMPGIDLGARDSATIGGMISTNAGGIEAFRHGVMRQRVVGLEAVLADGTVMSDLSHIGKCNEGYDVKQLFIGAEGTLGIVTRAVLRVVPQPVARATALALAPSMARALAAFQRTDRNALLAYELMNARYFSLATRHHGDALPFVTNSADFALVIEFEGEDEEQARARLEAHLEQALTEGDIQDAVVAKSEQERRQFWLLREDSWVVDRHHPGGLWFDVTIPLRQLPDYVARLERDLPAVAGGIQCFVIGHLGDGNLHLTIAGPTPLEQHKEAVSAVVYAGLKAIGGSFSAEHGIGLEKREALRTYGDPGKRKAMQAIKQALDPNNIMNPGKIL